MKQNYFLYDTERTQNGTKHTWDVPYDKLQYEPNMIMRIKGGSAVLTTVNQYKTIGVKLVNRSINGISSENTSSSLCGFLVLQNLSGNVTMLMEPYNIECIMKTNPAKWEFQLFDETNTVIPYANITNLNIILECEYLNNDDAVNHSDTMTKQN